MRISDWSSDVCSSDLSPADVPFSVLLPAFVTSELKTAFQIGFLIFLPFLVIDLVVAAVLMSLGMMMLSPTLISLPFKLLLFVLVDGWALTMGSLKSEEHTSELQSLMRTSYAVFCFKKQQHTTQHHSLSYTHLIPPSH